MYVEVVVWGDRNVFRSSVRRRRQQASLWPQCRLQLMGNDHSLLIGGVGWGAGGGHLYIVLLIKSLFTGDDGGIIWGADRPSRFSSTVQKNIFLMTSPSFQIIFSIKIQVMGAFLFLNLSSEWTGFKLCLSGWKNDPKWHKIKCNVWMWNLPPSGQDMIPQAKCPFTRFINLTAQMKGLANPLELSHIFIW